MNRPGLISVAELPIWVPGEILSASDALGWKDVAQRSYRYRGQDVEIPPMACFMIVHYRRGETPMDRQFDGRWTRTTCDPGHFSLLSRAVDSHWHWTEDVEVSHVYLTDELMCRVASDMQGKAVAEVQLDDVLRGSDPIVGHIAGEVTREAMQQGVGGPMYAEALSVQLAVHLLRTYATCKFKAPGDACRLSDREIRRLEDYVDAHLHHSITLEDMAQALGMGVWTLNRHLRRTLNASAYAFVVERRIQRARHLLRVGDLSLKEIAAAVGFSDQAHMTRMFRAKLGMTPGQYRSQV
ncbi:helix-turn-helix domain-containing protein [Variovorax sp. GT1P44]|uniref:helix-turn-helix domain-containing protein n=1 Tax=Variovorax sp. GT1P44 TaxID=3443742 RepID=UPI003F45F8BA